MADVAEKIDQTERLIAHLVEHGDCDRDTHLLKAARKHRTNLIRGEVGLEARIADALTPFYVLIARVQNRRKR